MNEDEEAMEYLENSLTKEQENFIKQKAGIESFHFEAFGNYDNYEDFNGDLRLAIISDDTKSSNGEIGYIVFDIRQRKFTLSEWDEMRDASFGDFIESAKVKEINILGEQQNY